MAADWWARVLEVGARLSQSSAARSLGAAQCEAVSSQTQFSGRWGGREKKKKEKRREEQKRDCTRHARANRRCMQQDFVSPRRRRFNLSSLSRHLRVLRGPLFHLPSVPRFRAPTTKARQATHALCTSTQSGPGVIDGTAGLLLI